MMRRKHLRTRPVKCRAATLHGEVAIFTSLVIVMVSALLFTAIEASRINAVGFYLQMASDAAMESCFGEYYLPLWEQYRLLFFLENESIADRAEHYIEPYAFGEGLIWGTSFMRFGDVDVEASSQYMTDLGAEAFYSEAVDYAEFHVVTEVIEGLTSEGGFLERFTDISNLMTDLNEVSDDAANELSSLNPSGNTSGADEEDAAGLSDALMGRIDEIEAQVNSITSDFSELNIPGGNGAAEEENGGSGESTSEMPRYSLRGVIGDAYLSFFVGNTENLSDTVISDDAVVSRDAGVSEEGNHSNGMENENGSVGSQVGGFFLFREYLLDQFSSYVSPNEEHEMSYELEYLLGGKPSDRSNLIYTIDRLMLIRGVVDFVENVADADKRAEALLLATAIGGFIGNEKLIRVFQYGILAVWTLNSAANEVKALLAGERVPFWKWNEQGYLNMGYEGYLRLLLYLKGTEKLKYRGMDLIQATMMEQDASFSVDRCIYWSEIQVTAESGALFTSLIDLGGGWFGGRSITASSEYGYG